MTTNRERTRRGPPRAAHPEGERQIQLDRRRADMHAAEGHAGSIPRGNQEPEQENVGHRHREWERLLGH